MGYCCFYDKKSCIIKFDRIVDMYQYNPFSLEGKVILITGASSGIGRATAIECAKMGASLIITGRDEERLKETFAKLEGFKNKVHMQIVADLSTEDGIKDLVNQIPQINGCVSNAGIVGLTPIQFVTTKKIEEMQQINLMAPVLLIKQILKQKKFQSQASIVFTSSVAGVYRVSMGNAIYSITKCGIDAYMRSSALELATKGIRCNSVNPAMVETRILNRGQLTLEQYEADKLRYPLKRYGKPEEVAWAIIYLLSDASAWVTGISLKLEGGMTLS